MRSLLFAAALTVTGSPASAQRGAQIAPRASYDRCIAESNGGDGPMAACVEAEAIYQDGRLNARYAQWMVRLKPRQKAALRASQRDWLRTRWLPCASEEKAVRDGGGTMERLALRTCGLDVLIARVRWLERYRP